MQTAPTTTLTVSAGNKNNDPVENVPGQITIPPSPPPREATPTRHPTPGNHCCHLRHSRVSPTPCCCRRDECQGMQGNNTRTDAQKSPAPHTPPRVAELLYADLVQSPPSGHPRPPHTPERVRKSRLSKINKNSTLTRSRSFRKILVSPTKSKEGSPEYRRENKERRTAKETSCSLQPKGTSSPQQ